MLDRLYEGQDVSLVYKIFKKGISKYKYHLAALSTKLCAQTTSKHRKHNLESIKLQEAGKHQRI